MDYFRKNLLKKLGEKNLRKIEAAHVGIAGAGGLGSHCAAHLVRTGFRRLTIADFDIVSVSNLDRQFYFMKQVGMKKTEALRANLLRIRPGLDLTMVCRKVTKQNVTGIFNPCDIIVECFDSALSKSMLVSRLLPVGKFVVAASGLGGYGDTDDLLVHRVRPSLYLIGDLRSDVRDFFPYAPRVAVVAAKQADVVLCRVLGDSGHP